MRTNRGFTLIELMVTIAVLAIIATLAAPSFGDMMTEQNLNKSTRDLTISLNEARSQAVTTRSLVQVYFADDVSDKYEEDIFKALPSDADVDEVKDKLSQRTAFIWIPSGNAQLKSGSPRSITFDITGVVSGANADTKFEICEKSGGKKSRIISISRMGTIQQIIEGTC